MKIFKESKTKKVINIIDIALSDGDDDLAKIKKQGSGVFGILSGILSGINKWRERVLSLILYQIDILDITVNTKKVAGVFESEIDNSAQKVVSVATATEEMSATAKEIAKNAVMAVGEAAGTVKKTKEGGIALDELIIAYSPQTLKEDLESVKNFVNGNQTKVEFEFLPNKPLTTFMPSKPHDTGICSFNLF